MSFGEGNLRERLAKEIERADMYRRQLGGVNAALRRERQKVRELEQRVSELEGMVQDGKD